MLVGNHDCYFKNSNEVNSVSLVLKEYSNITTYQDIPTVTDIGGLNVLFVPWIAPAHRVAAINEDTNCQGRFCYGSPRGEWQ